MATAVTLKESDGSEIYPVTDISLVNNGIHAVDIEATTPVPAVETAMIADGAVTTDKLGANAVTSAKIDWSTVGSTSSGILRVVTRDAYRTVTQGTYTVFTDDASPVIPSGYTPIGLVGLEMSGSGYTSMTMTTQYISGNTITWCCQSPITWDTGIHFYWRILCVKTS